MLLLLLSACVPPVARPPEVTAAPEGFPGADYRRLAAQGRPVYAIDSSRSLIVIEVRRGGSLARVGHDHVIAAHGVQGYVATDAGRSDFYLRLADLAVDEPELRAQAKLDTHPSEEDIAGTRRNMLAAFEAERYPFAVVHVERTGNAARLNVAATVHGTTRTLEIPANARVAGDELTIEGRTALKQSDFGVKPLSVLGGALQVLDQVDVRFSILARRMR